MKSLLFYPVLTVVSVAALMIYWIFVASYISSAGSDEQGENALSVSVAVRIAGAHARPVSPVALLFTW